MFKCPTWNAGVDGQFFCKRQNQRRTIFRVKVTSLPLKTFTFEIKSLIFSLEILDSSDSNFPPQPGKIQIPHPPGKDDSQMPMGFPGRGCGSFEMIETLETLNSGHFTLSTQLIVINPQRRRIAVSLETYPFYSFAFNDANQYIGNISSSHQNLPFLDWLSKQIWILVYPYHAPNNLYFQVENIN